MEKDIDWEKIARLLEKDNISGEELNKQELQAYLDAKELWNEKKLLNREPSATISDKQLEAGKAKIWQRIQQEQLTDAPNADIIVHSSSVHRKIWPGVATAAASLLLLLSVWVFTDNGLNYDKPFATNLSGTHRLPDQSKVELQEGSLSYQYEAGLSERQATLEGSAYFSVAKDPTSPFVIYCAKGKVKVIGTAFQLNARASNPEVLTVDEGIVAFYPEAPLQFPIYLRENERLAKAQSFDGWERTNTETHSTFQWNQNKLSFDATLGEIAQLVSDYTGKEIHFEQEDLRKLHIGSAGQGLEYKNSEEILQQALLPLSNQLSLIQNDKGWTIKRS